MESSLLRFQDSMAKGLYGMTKTEALGKGICIDCKEIALPKCYSEAGRREYYVSGLREECFDALCGE